MTTIIIGIIITVTIIAVNTIFHVVSGIAVIIIIISLSIEDKNTGPADLQATNPPRPTGMVKLTAVDQ